MILIKLQHIEVNVQGMTFACHSAEDVKLGNFLRINVDISFFSLPKCNIKMKYFIK